MDKPIIEVKNLGKKYHIGEHQPYLALRDSMANFLKDPFHLFRNGKKEQENKNDFWALKDVNFTVNRGDVIGIIGRNGAGKSTLLKILSQITPPTTGSIHMRGRVASLLEVGTGFHPELTGRENIYLNGALLGMKKHEIIQKFDQIVEFADIPKFLDTPVKRYSSGMYVRLAFSVAAHLDPEILIVDEVLAVGDSEFQKKCLGKMEEVTHDKGRTILFVSHNMGAVEQLCKKVIILKNGEIVFNGPTKTGVEKYLNSGIGLKKEQIWNKENAIGDNVAKILKIYTHNEDHHLCDTFDITKKIGITVEYEVLEDGGYFTHGLNLFNENGINVFNSHDVVSVLRSSQRKKGIYVATAWIPENLLAEGIFTAGIALFNPSHSSIHAHVHNALTFKVVDYIRGDSARGNYTGGFPGIVRPILNWETKIIK